MQQLWNIKIFVVFILILKQEAFEKCWAHSLLRAAVTLPVTWCGVASRTPAIAIAQAACDVHNDDDDNDNDNA